MHLAAQPIVRHAYDHPEETFSTNVLGTVHLLDLLRLRGRPCVVLVVTSDKVYEPNASSRAHVESDPVGGNDPYAASKAAAELVTQAFRRSYFPPEQLSRHGVKLASARAGNVIGGGDWAKDRIVVDAIRALIENRPIVVRNPHAIRPWQHITDVVHAYLTLTAAMCSSDNPELLSPWNLGPPAGNDVTVSDLVTAMCKAWGHGTWTNDSDPNAPFEAPALRLDSTKAMTKLGLRTRFSPEEAIRMTVRWYRAWHEGAKDIRGLSLRDLETHIQAKPAAMTHPEAKRG
jgi:CDP-glucose 4,6-dehydratase